MQDSSDEDNDDIYEPKDVADALWLDEVDVWKDEVIPRGTV